MGGSVGRGRLPPQRGSEAAGAGGGDALQLAGRRRRQIPFDVAEDAGPDSPFYRYLPLTARYVLEREGELRSLPAFDPACEAVEETGVAAPYLEARGETVPVRAPASAPRGC